MSEHLRHSCHTMNRGLRVLVTGATGTLGYNIVRLLAAETCYSIHAPSRRAHTPLQALSPRVTVMPLALGDIPRMAATLQELKPDVIVHCAACGLRYPKPSVFEMVHFNVDITLRLFDIYCSLKEARHFIYLSSGLVYQEQGRALHESDPIGTLHPYGASKAAADVLLQVAAAESGRTLTILRPFAFTGRQDGGNRLFPALIGAAAAGTPLALSAGEQVRDFCAVEDIARAVLTCIENGPHDQIERFNLGSGSARTIRELILGVCSELGLKIDLRFGEIPYRPHEPMHLVADINLAKQTLGWSPKVKLAHAVWELAREMEPTLDIRQPERTV